MYSVGISCYFHDSAIAVLKDGELIFYSMEDRFSRLKHDGRYPEKAIEYIKEELQLDMEPSNIESICFYEDNEKKFISLLNETLAGYPFKFRDFYKVIPQWIMKKFWIKSKLALSFKTELSKVKTGDHHLSHALYGHYSSGLERNAVICSDGYGDRASLTAYSFTKDGYKEVLRYDKDNSLGLIYTTFTTFFGFKANDGECSLMAISRFGTAKYRSWVEEALKSDEKEVYRVNSNFFNFGLDAECFYTEHFINRFGVPNREKFTVSSFEEREVSEKEQYYLDLAASFHEVFEEIYQSLFKKVYELTSMRNFVFCGGVAQNCVLVSLLEKLPFVDSIHIPLDPGDGGGAIGAAIYGSKAESFKVNQKFAGSRIGQKDQDKLVEIAKHMNDVELRFANEEERIEYLYQQIMASEVVGLFTGEMEVGPRALGHRSLLCRTDDPTVIEKLSHEIKTRAAFRPYALIMLEEDAYEMVEDYHPSHLVEGMQTVVSIKKEFHKVLHYGLHIDKTTRVQIVREEDNGFLYKLLRLKKNREGHSCLINTSFNQSGLPLISSPMDAFYFFRDRPMGALVIEGILASRN